MRLKYLSISGLFGKKHVDCAFNSDLNILTGRNGSGKTTILKLAWFIMSGNILLALKEIDFKTCSIVTDKYSCTVIRTGPVYCRVELEMNGEKRVYEDDATSDDIFSESAEDKANPVISSIGGSIFFPTFRRIEGGFSMNSSVATPRTRSSRAESEVNEALAALSRNLTNDNHTFVASIATQDISTLLLRKHALISEEINAFQGEVSRSVIDKIRHYESTQTVKQDADTLLSETRTEIEKIEQHRSASMQPLDAIRDLAERLFQHSGISFRKRLSFGDAAEAVSSDALSAGEKQMLSFICYNAFHKNSVVFIDEPELSLHVDWQRQLYSILNSQGSGNQFIFATHSPFIYGKYPDKEVALSEDRGDKNGE
ncbi:AAA family ATPase [Castellaniella sp. UC4442_H9]